MVKKILASALFFLGSYSLPAFATPTGFYVGGQLGYAQTGFDSGNAIIPLNGRSTDFSQNGDGFVVTIPTQFHSYVTGDNYTFSMQPLTSYTDKETSDNINGRIFVGYQFNSNFALEMGYNYLPETKLNITGTNNAIATKNSVTVAATQTLSNKIQESVIDLSTRWIYPYTDDLSFYGKIGAAYINAKQTATLTTNFVASNGETVPVSENLDTTSRTIRPLIGAGLDVSLTQNAFVELEFTHIQGNSSIPNIENGSVGIVYHFA